MKTFKQFYTKPAEFIAFSNAGGKEGQYDRFDYTESFMYGQGGGPKTSLDENLNPKANPEYIQSKSNTFFDPERNTLGLAEDHNTPRNLGIPDYYRNGYVHPHYTNEQAKHAAILSNSVHESNPHYHQFVNHYTANSYNLNNRLIEHHRAGKAAPDHVESHLDYDEDRDSAPIIHIPSFDKLIQSHRLPDHMIVYSGLHFHPNEHRGKIAVVPCYMSTSLSPHVAKDFGKDWSMTNTDGSHTTVRNILRLHLPKGHPGLYTDNGSHYPGQGELILPRGMRYQIGQKPTHIIEGSFRSHFDNGPQMKTQYHIYTGRII